MSNKHASRVHGLSDVTHQRPKSKDSKRRNKALARTRRLARQQALKNEA